MKLSFTKKGLAFPLLALLGLLLIIGVCRVETRTAACAVYVDGRLACKAESASIVKQEMGKLCREKARTLGRPVEIKSKIEYKTLMTDKRSVMSASELQKALAKRICFQTTGTTIVVNNEPVVTVSDEATARRVLERLKKEYTACNPGEKLLSVGFEEQVKIREAVVPVGEITSPDKALDILRTGTETPVTYEVKEGDSLWLIARRHDTHVEDIKRANRMEGEDLQPGQKLTISSRQPKIHVVTVIEGSRTEKIPYQTRVITDRSSSGIRVKQDGKEGQKQVIYRLTKKNGSTVESKITGEKILAQAVDRVIVKGRRLVIASRGGGSGILSWPIFGHINSFFGSRGRGFHTGIDIGGSIGEPIRAAASGRVVFAGWAGGYGRMVEISHGNGVITRYAHCSRILVGTGHTVSKGEVIARVGTTGHSTGPHLHFEVISGGGQRNPLRYLR